MKKRLFDDLKESLEEAVQISQGKKRPSRTFHFFNADDVRKIREQVGVSQKAFAEMLCISENTLQNWEQGRRIPRGSAHALLRVFAKNPKLVMEALA